MRVLRGDEDIPLEPGEVKRRLAKAGRVVVDVGTGDARWAYRLARANPSWLVVGIDPARDRLVEVARRTGRKPARGGIDNLWLVCTDIERAPSELAGQADEVHVLLPWGSLLRGVVRGEREVLAALGCLAKPGACVEITIGTGIWDEPVPAEIRDLPPVDTAHVRSELAPLYESAGLSIERAEPLTEAEWKALPSSWARRLAHGKVDPGFVHISARACRPRHR